MAQIDSSPPLPWWALPTVLSLDAPIVAVIWQFALAWHFDAPLPWRFPVVLGLTIWLIYVADRSLDALKLSPDTPATWRHTVYRRYYRVFLWLALPVACSVVLMGVLEFSRREQLWGSGILLLVIIYGVALHRQTAGSLLKEVWIGGVFALGVTLPLWLSAAGWELFFFTLMFGVLCTANCLFIAIWEAPIDRAQGTQSLIQRYPAWSQYVYVATWILGGSLLVAGLLSDPVLLAMGLSFVVLAALHRWRDCSSELRRVLADAALLTPCLLPLLPLMP